MVGFSSGVSSVELFFREKKHGSTFRGSIFAGCAPELPPPEASRWSLPPRRPRPRASAGPPPPPSPGLDARRLRRIGAPGLRRAQ